MESDICTVEVLDYKIALEASEACELKKKTFLQSDLWGH